ncbi:uncharacterized protein LOC102807069 [Saccoglossus kowalevskii]|uniref:Uncharacterized protein LOC102807069 n=1 Tax=Saccoglossus kowalevskii TaxID=10224 RepID=A0ABM0MI71_SACKO|nr:PREDICTED: uncharacterized protein LOC102807069 [Saccoglossus kowalevskii]
MSIIFNKVENCTINNYSNSIIFNGVRVPSQNTNQQQHTQNGNNNSESPSSDVPGPAPHPPGHSVPGPHPPGHSVPGPHSPGHSVPGPHLPGHSVPGPHPPGHSVPGPHSPGHSVPGPHLPGHSVPGPHPPGHSVPGSHPPGHSESNDIHQPSGNGLETQPSDVAEPRNTQPGEIESAEDHKSADNEPDPRLGSNRCRAHLEPNVKPTPSLVDIHSPIPHSVDEKFFNVSVQPNPAYVGDQVKFSLASKHAEYQVNSVTWYHKQENKVVTRLPDYNIPHVDLHHCGIYEWTAICDGGGRSAGEVELAVIPRPSQSMDEKHDVDPNHEEDDHNADEDNSNARKTAGDSRHAATLADCQFSHGDHTTHHDGPSDDIPATVSPPGVSHMEDKSNEFENLTDETKMESVGCHDLFSSASAIGNTDDGGSQVPITPKIDPEVHMKLADEVTDKVAMKIATCIKNNTPTISDCTEQQKLNTYPYVKGKNFYDKGVDMTSFFKGLNIPAAEKIIVAPCQGPISAHNLSSKCEKTIQDMMNNQDLMFGLNQLISPRQDKVRLIADRFKIEDREVTFILFAHKEDSFRYVFEQVKSKAPLTKVVKIVSVLCEKNIECHEAVLDISKWHSECIACKQYYSSFVQ